MGYVLILTEKPDEADMNFAGWTKANELDLVQQKIAEWDKLGDKAGYEAYEDALGTFKEQSKKLYQNRNTGVRLDLPRDAEPEAGSAYTAQFSWSLTAGVPNN